MAIETKLTAEPRANTGTGHSRRLRRNGQVPGNVCGLGQESISVTLDSDPVTAAIMAGHQVVELSISGTTETALIRDVQWDTFLTHILHVDFQRIDPNQRLDIEISVFPRGTVNEGVLDHLMHTLEVNCPVYGVPDSIGVKIGNLRIGDSVTVGDLALPPGVTTSVPADTVVFRVHAAQDVEIVQEDMSSGAEPEVIGRAKADDEE